MSHYTYSSVNLTNEQRDSSNEDNDSTENVPGAQIVKGSQKQGGE
jgi:hypothetical protein